MNQLIKPRDVINKMGVDGLCRTAEDYFKNIDDARPLLSKPFHNIMDGPTLLCKLGQLLSGLRLGKGMTVVDFGAGSCWLSRFLNELSCATISVDPSPSALKMGEQLFKQLPVINESIAPPNFLEFDGYKIDLPDNSVDRVICFDSFHHVPNPGDILAEFYRILKPGGIAGFSEVGPIHSTSASSQMEMKTFNVLENDILLEDFNEAAQKIGFSEPWFKFFSHPDLEMNFKDYLRISRKRKIPKPIKQHLTTSMTDSPVFFMSKGNYVPDSRHHSNLHHSLNIEKKEYTAKKGEEVTLTVELKNSGEALWLHRNVNNIGVVNLGIHLQDREKKLLDYDFARFNLGRDISSGEGIDKIISLKLKEPGTFHLTLDLVAEEICWFENNGSQPMTIRVNIL